MLAPAVEREEGKAARSKVLDFEVGESVTVRTARSRRCRRRSPRSTPTLSSSRCWSRSSAGRRRSSSSSARSRRSDGRLDPQTSSSRHRTPEKEPESCLRRRSSRRHQAADHAGPATPAPPVGPALGQHGVNIMEFCKPYNAATESQRGNVMPVEITVYEDRSFTFITKTPPAARLILKAAGVDKGRGVPHSTKVAKLTRDQVREIAADQDARPERERHRRRREDHRRHRPLDGHHRQRLTQPTPAARRRDATWSASGRAHTRPRRPHQERQT